MPLTWDLMDHQQALYDGEGVTVMTSKEHLEIDKEFEDFINREQEKKANCFILRILKRCKEAVELILSKKGFDEERIPIIEANLSHLRESIVPVPNLYRLHGYLIAKLGENRANDFLFTDKTIVMEKEGAHIILAFMSVWSAELAPKDTEK